MNALETFKVKDIADAKNCFALVQVQRPTACMKALIIACGAQRDNIFRSWP